MSMCYSVMTERARSIDFERKEIEVLSSLPY